MGIKLGDFEFSKVLVFPKTTRDGALGPFDVKVCVLHVGLPACFRVENLTTWRSGISFWQFGTLPIGIFFVKFGLKIPYDIS